MYKILIKTLILIAICAAVFADDSEKSLTVSVPQGDSYVAWFSYIGSDARITYTIPETIDLKSPTLNIAGIPKDADDIQLHIQDLKTGLISILNFKEPIEKNSVKLSSKNFNRLSKILVEVISQDLMDVAHASVTMIDSEKHTENRILTPSDGGVLEFREVPQGTVKITVKYSSANQTSQEFNVQKDAEGKLLKFKITLPGDVDAVGISKDKPGETATAPTEPIAHSALDYIISLAILIVIGAVIYIYGKDKGYVDKFMEYLKKDQPVAEEDKPVMKPLTVPEGICPFCGEQKDPVTGECACSVKLGAPGQVPVSLSGGPRLVTIQGPGSWGSTPLGNEAFTIGRESGNSMVLAEDTAVSRKHARIIKEGGNFKVYDEGSSNGIYVNGVKVPSQELHNGDKIQIGTTVFRFED